MNHTQDTQSHEVDHSVGLDANSDTNSPATESADAAKAIQFTDLGLSAKVLAAVSDAGYVHPTPIQAGAIPPALERKDILGIAQTGTGKTAAFVLPMITLLEKGRARARMPRTLILEPTRELAAQVEENFVKYGKNHKLNVALLIGGVSFDEQEKKLERGADVLIATPGRLLDHHERGKLLLTGVDILVIDEADRMLDMGFIPDIERIAKLTPMTRQTLFFSATMPPEITRLADQFLHSPVRVEVTKPAQTAKTITQMLVATGSKDWDKRAKLRELIDREAPTLKNAIIFCNRKVEVADLLRSLLRHEYDAGALHGDMDQRSRMATLDGFRNGKLKLLVASDVAARGLDIPDVSHVFNFDVPIHAEDYVHRIGRTGRAGRSGAAFMIVTKRDGKALDAILKLTGDSVNWLDGDLSTVVESADDGRGESRDRKGRGRDSGRERGRGRDGSKGRGPRDHAEKTPPSAVESAAATLETTSSADNPAVAEQRSERPARRGANPKGGRQAAVPREDGTVQQAARAAAVSPAGDKPAVSPAGDKPNAVAKSGRDGERSRQNTPRDNHRGNERDDKREDRNSRDNDNARSPRGFGDELPAFMRNGLN